jgi:hypothetical protein
VEREVPAEAIEEEARRARRAQRIADLTCSILSQQSDLTLGEAMQLMAGARRQILALFPGGELPYRLLYHPRFLRILVERFNLPKDEIDFLPQEPLQPPLL